MTKQELPPLVLNPRQRELLNYLKNRINPVSTIALAQRFKVTTACITGNLRPLLMAGEVERTFRFEQTSVAGKVSKLGYYKATKPIPSKRKRPDTPPPMFNDPFNLGRGRERVNTQVN
jgi:predicted ArsR family transcriptional regulator